VLSVADVFLPPSSKAKMKVARWMSEAIKKKQARAVQEVKKAFHIALKAQRIFHRAFPQWKLKAYGVADSPAWGIIKKAVDWKADLIVVGSPSGSSFGKWVMGSAAQKVLAEARCSVRIVHERVKDNNSPVRIVIGFDGSADAKKAIQAVAGRNWKKGSAVHVTTVVDPRMETDVTAARSWMEFGDKGHAWVHRMKEKSIQHLHQAGLIVSSLIKEGDPKRVLIAEAKNWGADCIFVGARGLSGMERLFLGSVSISVASHAPCTVEVVR
jgi:nucleotide-binding universal stress UspA family protein